MMALVFVRCTDVKYELLWADFKPACSYSVRPFSPVSHASSLAALSRLPAGAQVPLSVARCTPHASPARVAIAHLEKEGLIKPVIRHRAQLVYTRTTSEE